MEWNGIGKVGNKSLNRTTRGPSTLYLCSSLSSVAANFSQDESSGQDGRELSEWPAGPAGIDRSNMNYWLLGKEHERARGERTSPTDLATFASRTITWSALQRYPDPPRRVSYCRATDWFFFRDISLMTNVGEWIFGKRCSFRKDDRVNYSKNDERCVKAWL